MKTFNEYQVRAHETSGPYEEACESLIVPLIAQLSIDGTDMAQAAAAKHHVAVLGSQLRRDYVTMGLAGEAGEFANKMKKVLRDGKGEMDKDMRTELAKELGGVLWYLAECCTVLGLNFGDIADLNLAQLKARASAGTLQGSGDNR